MLRRLLLNSRNNLLFLVSSKHSSANSFVRHYFILSRTLKNGNSTSKVKHYFGIRSFNSFSSVTGELLANQTRLIRNGTLLFSTVVTLLWYHQFKSLKVASCKREILPGEISELRKNSDTELELFDAIRGNDTRKVDQIVRLESFDVNSRHSLGWTPLHLAAILGKPEIVQKLLDAGADIDAIDEFSNAAQIAYEHRLNFLQVHLIREEEFSDILSPNVSFLGTTALHYACLCGSVETIRVLMKNHANPNLENEFGHKPEDYLNHSDARIAKLLPEFSNYCKEYQEYINQLKMEERRKFPLEQRIREVIVGQEAAIATVSATIRRKENGWIDNEHPLVFLFLGSSGIGKTELAKQVANYLHSPGGGDQKKKERGKSKKSSSKLSSSSKQSSESSNHSKGFIRIDMSEYQEKHEVSKFIGSPPGYVGHDDGGQLTKALTECPNAVVLFDEVEKAHPDVLTIMLQLFDEGRLTDGKGRTIECKDAIFIMTSNLASEEIAEYGIRLRRESEELAKVQYSGKLINETETENLDKVVVSRYFKDKVIRPILKRHFKRDEFLGRINEIVYFLPFSRSELHKLVTRELELWSERAAQRHRIKLTWDRKIIGVLANGYDVHYGARSIKYEVERRVVNKLASAHENRLMLPGAKVHVVVSEDGEEFKFTKLLSDYGHDKPSSSSASSSSTSVQSNSATISGDSGSLSLESNDDDKLKSSEELVVMDQSGSTEDTNNSNSNKHSSKSLINASPNLNLNPNPNPNIEPKLKLLIENPTSSDSSPKRSFLNKLM